LNHLPPEKLPPFDERKSTALGLFREIIAEMDSYPLRTLFWECTLRCMLNCKHCGSDCKSSSTQADMPAQDFLRVLDSIKPKVNSHEVMIVLTGGEPLMRDDLEEIGRAIYDREFPWGIVTNGMLLDLNRMNALLAAGIHSIALSIDGFEKEHNEIRRNPQSYERSLRALRLIVRSPRLVYDVVTCVNKDNIKYLPAFRDFLISEGVKAWRLFTIFPVGRAALDAELQLSNGELRYLMDFIRSCRKDAKIKISYGCEGFLGPYEAEVRDHLFFCAAGMSIAGIRIDGSISGCTSIRANFDQGNIYRDDFMQVWNNRFEKYRNRDWCKKGKCAQCSMFKYCEGSSMHLYDNDENLLTCHYERLTSP